MNFQPTRQQMLEVLDQDDGVDLIIIGGGASGLGIAVDAATRGFSTILLESHDFAKGTSSRATKLVHGGVRYLAQGNITLVREALRERQILLDNAAHLAQPLPFVVPGYGFRGCAWDLPIYRTGLALYDALAKGSHLGKTCYVSRQTLLQESPQIQHNKLCGGVRYWDGQFDDARLSVALARTAIQAGATVLNYCRVTKFLKADSPRGHGHITGVVVEDQETKRNFSIRGKCVVNAAGVWADSVRRLDDPCAMKTLAPSQGAHIVVDRSFFPSQQALLVPKTTDGRVMFAVPWMGKVILGTTDIPRDDLPVEPRPLPTEIDFILEEASRYLAHAPQRSDIRAAWAGLRPLVQKPHHNDTDTKQISREHIIRVSEHGLVTVSGGKWTTYRAMAEDVLLACFSHNLLPSKTPGVTKTLRLVGSPSPKAPNISLADPPGLHLYGSEIEQVLALPGSNHELLPGLSEAMVRFAVRHEYARTVEDVLARRSRWLFLDAQAASDAADAVGHILQEEIGSSFNGDASVKSFRALASEYQVAPHPRPNSPSMP